MELFEDKTVKTVTPANAPLAERMRPLRLSDFVGQAHLLGEGRFLKKLIEDKKLASLILWGPPGSGKTTLARIIAHASGAEFLEFSAVLAGVKDVREAIDKAKTSIKSGKKTVLFVDEIHRFNKAQQDAFLHSVEDGTITLIGATTENPSFEVISALLSRCKVLTLNPLTDDEVEGIVRRAFKDAYEKAGVKLDENATRLIAENSGGDARAALNTLETAILIAEPDANGAKTITPERVAEAMQKKLLYDKGGEEHYNVISAFIKSMRGSDPHAAIYWLSRMVESGEDPLFIARRMVIFASEDIGNADPQALVVALNVKDAVDFVGMPEGFIPLSQGVAYLATAPKSNASYKAYLSAVEDVRKKGALPVPLHIRNAPTRLMKDLGYGKGYKYPHDYEGAEVDQQYLPDALKDKVYYRPTNRGFEEEIQKRMSKKEKPDKG